MTAMNGRKFCGISLLAAAAMLPVLAGGCPNLFDLLTPEVHSDAVQDVTPSEAQALIQSHQGDPNFVILDVRTAQEYAGGHIANAVNVCLLCSVSFQQDVDTLDKTRTYLVYCQSGRRSTTAAGIMAEDGFANVYNMTSGLGEWVAEGFPTVQP